MTITSRYIRHIIVFALLVIVVALGGVLTYRAVVHTEAQVVRIRELQRRTTSYADNKKLFALEAQAVSDLAKRISADEQYLITTATTPVFLSNLEALAQAYGVEFTITGVQTPGKQKNKLMIDFAASGELSQVQAFLAALSRQTYQVSFAKLALFLDQKSSTTWDALASMQVVSFYTP